MQCIFYCREDVYCIKIVPSLKSLLHYCRHPLSTAKVTMQFPLASVSIALFFVPLTFASIIKTEIEAGTVQGAKCAQNDVTSFQSIPYAQPPVGSLRFAAPQAFQGKYSGSYLNATTVAPSCIQFGQAFIEHGRTSEDWLVA